jgi:hypothetical protein
MLHYFFPEVKNLINYKKEIYVLEENRFIRDREMSFEDIIHYLILNKGKTTVLELDSFFKEKYGYDKLPISKQDLSQQRQYIDPLIFKDMNKNALKKVYTDKKYPLRRFKGYHVFAIDGTELKLPNTKIAREEFDVQKRALKETNTPKARASVFYDVKNDFVIDSIISKHKIGEHPLAFQNIENADKIINFNKSIVIFDRNYASSELFFQLNEKNSKYIFRLKKDTYKKERKRMKTDDEWVEIKINSNRTKQIKNPDLKQKAKETTHLKLRIVNIPLETGEIETLITNIGKRTATTDELKELYNERWAIENGYNIIKNKIHIENFSAQKKISVEQDFYSQITMYNILIEYKIDINQKIKEKNKNHTKEYKTNINILAGKLKEALFQMIFAKNEKEQNKIEERVYYIAQKNTILVKKKETTPRKTNPAASKYPQNNRKNF